MQKYDLRLPLKVTNPVVFSSPHSGRDYPKDFVKRSVLSKTHLRSSEDAFVEELFAGIIAFGSPLLAALAPRAYVDVNRDINELDPSIIDGAKAAYNNPRIASGLGVIPRVVSDRRHIQTGKISMDEAQDRLEKFYTPYHKILEELLTQAKLKFGISILLDCHSMPSDALQNAMAPDGARPDIILGNRFGASTAQDVFDVVETAFIDQGFIVGRNTPFAGGYITQKYGVPSQNQHTIQIEINRGLYMNEKRVRKTRNFENIQTALRMASRDICNNFGQKTSLAAE